MKAYELLADPTSWLKGPDNYTENDGPCCVLGALRRVYAPNIRPTDVDNETFYNARNKLYNYLGVSIVDWNDDPQRTHAEVVAALRACDL